MKPSSYWAARLSSGIFLVSTFTGKNYNSGHFIHMASEFVEREFKSTCVRTTSEFALLHALVLS